MKLLSSLLLLCLTLAACKKAPGEDALQTDANGFLCRQCAHKFFTDRDLFPDHCPKCKSDRFVEAVGFLCPKDQQVTIVARGPNSVLCEKCRAPVDSLKLPRQSEFQSWGATKAEKPQISGGK